MTQPIMIEEKPISMSEAKHMLDVIKKRDSELGFRATKTEEYLTEFAPMPAKKAEELRENPGQCPEISRMERNLEDHSP